MNMTPKVEKIVLNMGLGVDGNDNKIIKSCEEDLEKLLVKNLYLQNLKSLFRILKQEKIQQQV